MSLTGNWTLAMAISAAVAAVAAVVFCWDRVSRQPWLRWPARASMLIACQLTACLVVALFVNDQGLFFTSWSDLLGNGSGTSTSQVRPGAYDRQLAAPNTVGEGRKDGLVLPVPIPEADGSRSNTALVYLPPQYFDRAYANRAFPVFELLGGYPGSPRGWTGPLDVQQIADQEIAAGRAVPFVAVIPTTNYVPHRDGECINAVGGHQVETTLTVNVRRAMERDFRVSSDRSSWAVAGVSTGGFCAVNIALRHPDMFAAAVSMSGYDHPYIDSMTGALFGHGVAARDANDPLWRLTHLPAPNIALLLGNSRQDVTSHVDATELAAAARPPTRVDLLTVPRGGHNFHVWVAMEPTVYDWLSHIVAAPLAPAALAEGVKPTTEPNVPLPATRTRLAQRPFATTLTPRRTRRPR
jgi:S-formylglutathione hydrolase FrmB